MSHACTWFLKDVVFVQERLVLTGALCGFVVSSFYL
jgi:hypothetical protein